MINYKSPAEIEQIRESGRVVARALNAMAAAVAPGITTEDLDQIAADVVAKAGGLCSFLNYRGYPKHTCISVNEQVIHGIPSKDQVLKEGDIVDLDMGVILNGWHADSSITVPVGKVSEVAQRLMSVTKESLNQGIAKTKIGNRMGDMASTVQKYVERNGYSVVRDLVGHGIGRDLHEEPSVPNFGKAGHGVPFREGMVICIEPMVNQGTYKVITLSDGWTIITADRKLSAHFEHTVAVTKNGPVILTLE